MSEDNTVVIDSGSALCRVGLAGEDEPTLSFTSAVVHNIKNQEFIGYNDQSLGHLTFNYPKQNGIVTDWDGMEKIWDHAFIQVESQVAAEGCNLLVTEPMYNPVTDREKMTEIMFETFGVGAMYVALPSVLSIFERGRYYGAILEVGDGVISTCCVCDGFLFPQSLKRINFGGRDLTHRLMNLLSTSHGYTFSSSEREIVSDIKEKLCYVSPYQVTNNIYKDNNTKTYQLPDGKTLTLGSECYRCPEVLFNPSLADQKFSGVHQLIYDSIMKCDIDERTALFTMIVLMGGSARFPGFEDRILGELLTLAEPMANFKTMRTQVRPLHAVWLGGSILASLSSFQSMWIPSHEYSERGPSCTRDVHNIRIFN